MRIVYLISISQKPEIDYIYIMSIVYSVDFINKKPEIDLKFDQQLFLSLKC